MGIGITFRDMVKGLRHGSVGIDIKGIGRMITRMVRAYIRGRTGISTDSIFRKYKLEYLILNFHSILDLEMLSDEAKILDQIQVLLLFGKERYNLFLFARSGTWVSL